MKARLKISDLSAALARLKGIVSRKSTLPILGNVLMVATDAGMTLSGTDLDAYLTLDVPGEVGEAGAITVPCDRLAKALAKMEGEEVELKVGKPALLSGKSGSMKFELLGLEAAEFPPVPTLADGAEYSFEAGVIADGLARSLSAVSDDVTRYVLNGVCFVASGGSLQMICTDGRRLSLTSVGQCGDLSVIVPTDSAALMACLDGGGATVLKVDANQIEARGVGWRVVSKLIEGTYPNWKQVLPAEGAAHRFTVERSRLIEAVRFAATLCTKGSNAVKIVIGANLLTLSASTPGLGTASAEVTADVVGAEMTAAFNWDYLLRGLEVLAADNVSGEIANDVSPLRLTDGKTVNVLMPMRLW